MWCAQACRSRATNFVQILLAEIAGLPYAEAQAAKSEKSKQRKRSCRMRHSATASGRATGESLPPASAPPSDPAEEVRRRSRLCRTDSGLKKLRLQRSWLRGRRHSHLLRFYWLLFLRFLTAPPALDAAPAV